MDGMAITVENHSAKAVDAMYFDYLVGEKVVMHQFCINTEGLGPWIEPGKSLRLPAHPLPPQRYPPGTPVSCRIDGVVFTDGTTEGPNAWQVGRLVTMRNQMYTGQVVVIGSQPDRGDSGVAFYLLSQSYKRLHPGAEIRTRVE